MHLEGNECELHDSNGVVAIGFEWTADIVQEGGLKTWTARVRLCADPGFHEYVGETLRCRLLTGDDKWVWSGNVIVQDLNLVDSLTGCWDQDLLGTGPINWEHANRD